MGAYALVNVTLKFCVQSSLSVDAMPNINMLVWYYVIAWLLCTAIA